MPRKPRIVFAWPIGTKVTIGHDIEATVTGIIFRGAGLTYEVAWWSGRERKTDTIAAHEVIDVERKCERTIGFHAIGD